MAPLRSFTDQMQNEIEVVFPQKRIISLVPSQTELLNFLGLEEEVVGITKFCEHPKEWFRTKTRVGGTKQVHFDRIAALQPDLIIGNKEENDRAQIEALRQQYPVWMSDIKNLKDALEMIQLVGELVNCEKASVELCRDIEIAFMGLSEYLTNYCSIKTVAYLIWREPYMAAAKDTFIDDLLQRAGFENIFAAHSRYPEISRKQLQQAAPECIFLSSEPYPFREKHLAELQTLCPKSVIKLVDGSLFSWYSNRLLLAPAYFLNLH